MSYKEEWEEIERVHDSTELLPSKELITPSLYGFGLNELLIIENWIDYAKGIGDESAYSVGQQAVNSKSIYSIAKSRSKPSQLT